MWAAKVLLLFRVALFFSCSIAMWNAKKMVIKSLLQKLLNKCRETSLKSCSIAFFADAFFGLVVIYRGMWIHLAPMSFLILPPFIHLSLCAFYFRLFFFEEMLKSISCDLCTARWNTFICRCCWIFLIF